MRKYASLEQARVLDLKGSRNRSKTASLEKIGDFHDYRTEDGYLYARIRAISSRVNKNHDGWPSVELAGGEDIFNRHAKTSSEGFTLTAAEGNAKYGFATFLGKPVFVDHNNSDPSRARGVIVDAKLHVEDHKTAALDDPYYASAPDNHMPPTWVELLLEVDAKSFPKLAKAIIAGAKDPKRGIDGFSMGCDVERSVCSICKNSASSPDDFCNHVKLKGAEFDSLDSHGSKTSKRSYEDCYGIKFFEISAVFDPADETALIREVKSAVIKEAKVAQNPEPQSDLMTIPEEVDTLRQEEVCPVCGSSMESGHQCDVCGYVPPPEGFDNPDLEKSQERDNEDQLNQLVEQAQPTELGKDTQPTQVNTDPNNMQPVSSVRSSWQVHHPKLGGRINPVERPLKPGNLPSTNEPNETIISDQDKPVTNRTAASMIAAVNKENNMSRRIAADAPTQDTKADKRVDVNGVGGVMDASNEQASKPDVDTNVTGKGGITDASNAEASKPDRTESLPTAGEGSDDSGFNKDKTTDDSGKTRTWDNSNEPGSAVTQKAFPTAAQVRQAWGDEKPFPNDETAFGESSGAKGGAEPADPVGKADERVDLLQRVPVGNPQKGTDQWTGTGGNGVTKQQDPVTRNVDPNIDVKKMTSVVELFKIADAEVELGLINAEDKYERIAELESASVDEIRATAKVLARVKTAGLSRRTASTSPQGIGRVPSMRPTASTQRTASVVDESIFW